MKIMWFDFYSNKDYEVAVFKMFVNLTFFISTCAAFSMHINPELIICELLKDKSV